MMMGPGGLPPGLFPPGMMPPGMGPPPGGAPLGAVPDRGSPDRTPWNPNDDRMIRADKNEGGVEPRPSPTNTISDGGPCRRLDTTLPVSFLVILKSAIGNRPISFRIPYDSGLMSLRRSKTAGLVAD